MVNIAFIPVRGGSKSIPLKNIKPLAGKPLVFWTAQAANDAKCTDKVIIATDSEEIQNTVSGFGLPKIEIYSRNPENAQDTSSTESVMSEYINQSELNPNDRFFLIQATSPLIKSRHIDEMYEQFIQSGTDSALSCVRTKRFFWDDCGKPINYDYMNRPRRQDFRGLMTENGACYINSVGNIIKFGSRICGKIFIYEMPEYTAVEIDEPDDFLLAAKLMEKHKNE